MPADLSLHQEHRNQQDAFRPDRPADISLAAPRRRPGLAARFLAWLTPGKQSRPRRPTTRHTGESTGKPTRPADDPENKDLGMARTLISQDRYGFVLLKQAMGQIADDDARAAWQALNTQMALVPAGSVPLILCDGSFAAADFEGFHLDRCAVTNQQFQRFVLSGAYDDLQIWPTEVWPSVARFTDLSGRPGPREWENGKFPAGKAEHPVVGVCWYEAVAYARWVGKRLPTAAEWQKAGGWPEQLSGGMCNRYPWGNMFEPARTNLSASGVGQTTPVREYPSGATPNGIYQMTGNVWEWLDDPLETIPCQTGEYFQSWKPLRRIIGGAFNADFRGGVTRLIRTQFCRWRGRFSVVFPASAICGASPHKQEPPHFLPPPRRVSPAFILASLSPRPLICGPFPHDELLLPWDQTARPTSQMG